MSETSLRCRDQEAMGGGVDTQWAEASSGEHVGVLHHELVHGHGLLADDVLDVLNRTCRIVGG